MKLRAKLQADKEYMCNLCSKYFIRGHDLVGHKNFNAYHAALRRSNQNIN